MFLTPLSIIQLLCYFNCCSAYITQTQLVYALPTFSFQALVSVKAFLKANTLASKLEPIQIWQQYAIKTHLSISTTIKPIPYVGFLEAKHESVAAGLVKQFS